LAYAVAAAAAAGGLLLHTAHPNLRHLHLLLLPLLVAAAPTLLFAQLAPYGVCKQHDKERQEQQQQLLQQATLQAGD
jgi:hypothetical protein